MFPVVRTNERGRKCSVVLSPTIRILSKNAPGASYRLPLATIPAGRNTPPGYCPVSPFPSRGITPPFKGGHRRLLVKLIYKCL